MAKVELAPEILSISGKVGNMMFKTRKDGKVFAYKAPEYARKKPFSDREIAAHELMTRRQKRVVELMKTGLSRSEAWVQVKQEITR